MDVRVVGEGGEWWLPVLSSKDKNREWGGVG